jgi:hypothetical protein
MKKQISILLFSALAIVSAAAARPVAQDKSVGDDVKDAGKATGHAAKKTGKDVEKGTKKAAKKTKNGVHKAADATADKTK